MLGHEGELYQKGATPMAKNKNKKKNGTVLWSVLSIVLAVAIGGMAYGTNLAFASAQVVNTALKTATNKTVNSDSSAIYYETGFSSAEELEAHDQAVAEQVAAEGAVLLKNDNNTLPLTSGAAVSTFSHSTVDPVTCGTGSAYIDTSVAPTLKEALEAKGFTVNPTLWDFYATGAGSEYVRTPSGSTTMTDRSAYNVNEVPLSVYTDEVKSSYATYNDAAIVMISRISGECMDLEMNDYLDGNNVLNLTPEEQDMLTMVSENFDKVVVLINSTNAMECDWFDDYGIDAVLWIGYTGDYGLNAVASILVGDVNPSGKLVDTYCYDNTTAPSIASLYGNVWANYDENDTDNWYSVYGGVLDGNNYYITYEEGIYIGYRYYETRYEDVVLGTAGVGSYDYASTVAYPFGYGLSYTDFTWSDFSTSYDKTSDSFTVSVTVTNSGAVAGKDVVQVYFQSPYTDYDRLNNVEKASVELCGFAKTAELAPNESETVTITIPREELAAYDSNGAKTYILDEGSYYLTAAHDAHDAVNNVLATKGYTTANGMTAEGDTSRVFTYINDELDTTTYSVSSATGYAITNQFDDTDLNYYDGYEMTYLSRSNWEGTWPTGMAGLEASQEMLDGGLTPHLSYTGVEGSTTEYPTMGADNGMTLGMMIGKDYDDPDWDKLLDQATFEEMATLIGQGYHNTAMMVSVSKPSTVDDNGPQGFTQALTGVSVCHAAYSDENTMAATWNIDLLYELGECLGADVLDLGATGLYGPAMDTHRNAYAGRNFEYYSEDGFLSGKIAAAEVSGIQSKGVYVYIKHFALNDSETGCRCISTFANEQSIREIYLKPFETAVVEGGAWNVMNSFARFGVTWSGAHYGLQTEVLRNEWGLRGFSLTDFSGNSAMYVNYGIVLESFDVAQGLLAGTDSWDSSATQWSEELVNLYKDDADVAQAMRQATHRILYAVVNSNAMNTFTADTKIVEVTPWWQTALKVADALLVILFILSVVKLVLAIREKKAAQ
jgi:beta-glucosidase